MSGANPIPSPVDQAVRDRLATEFDQTFFVEAGAGTGKTTTLVGRIVAMIAAGRLKTSELVAITFTEAAAAELRARVREALEAHGTPETMAAAASLEEASIDTIHSFAGALLRTYPLESGLPPNFDTLDQIEQDLEFRDRFRAWFEAAAERESSQKAIKNALLLGLTPDRIEGVAQALHEHYDLLDGGMNWAANPARPALESAPRLAERLQKIETYREECLQPEADKLHARLGEIAFCAERLAQADTEGKALVAMLQLERFPRLIGNQGNWRFDSLKRLRAELNAILDEMVEILKGRRAEVLNSLLKALRDFVLEYSDDRRLRGVATFHDLLTWARDLLRDQPEVRARAQRRWSRIFIDEFQDTDPLQAEIAFYLAAQPGQEFPKLWLDAPLTPGKLFLVGDPKQSIYRFRRADIALYQKIQERVGGDEALVQNFRSVPPVIDFVNRHFSDVMHYVPDVQPEYRPLVAEMRREGSLRWFGSELKKPAGQDQVWRAEAADVARACRLIKDQAWPVSRGKGEQRRLEPAGWQDICVLIPTRTNLRRLEKEFEKWSVPYRLESGELIVMTQEVRELISCLRAIDDPSDQVAIVAALRSGAYGCSDVELGLWHDAGGRFDYMSMGADGLTEPEAIRNVRAALGDLKQLHFDRHSMTVPALVEHFLDDRLLVAQAFGQARPRETWRRYRYVAKRARDFAATGRATLRSFVEWMEGLEREQYRDPGISAAEEDDDAVRVLTIHGAKGLEFPIVLMTGWGSAGRGDRTTVLPDRIAGRLEVGIGENWQTYGYQKAADREKEAQKAESVRLTYVAATRARDHLLLSLWRKERFRSGNDPVTQAEAFSETLADGDLGAVLDLSAARMPVEVPPAAVDQPEPAQHLARERAWEAERRRLIEELGGLRITSASGLAREADPDEDVEDEAILRRGRGGTNFGRAVHAVLQVLPLDSLAGLEELARAQAAAEGIASRAPAVVEAVRRVAASAPLRAAVAAARLWREVPVGATEAGVVVEGFIDLLYEDAGGLRVVDYKTDNASAAKIERRFRHYRLQGGAYALLISLVTGRGVAGVDFVFSANGEVRSIEGPELAALVEEVRARLGQGPAAGDEDDGDGAGAEQRQPEGEPVVAAEPADHDAGDHEQREPEGDQLQLTWVPRSEQDR
jgi:ATP-dependent helicase/nuclease subunit A